MKTILIIVGSARSGSTLLAKALGGHSKGFTLGEINRFNNEIKNPETHCGCGLKLKDCQFWKEVLEELGIRFQNPRDADSSFQVGIFKQLTQGLKILKLIPLIVFKTKYRDKKTHQEIENTITLYRTLFNKTKAQVLIDSSKNLFRALVLASRVPSDYDVRIVQLSRDGRGVLNSALKTNYKIDHADGITRTYEGIKGKNPTKVIRSWVYVNLRNFLILKLFYRARTSFVKYEDFTADPSKYLTEILMDCKLDFEPEALDLGGKENHIMGGNPSRINAKVIKKQDDAWRKNLDKKLLAKFNFSAGWLNYLIGYRA